MTKDDDQIPLIFRGPGGVIALHPTEQVVAFAMGELVCYDYEVKQWLIMPQVRQGVLSLTWNMQGNHLFVVYHDYLAIIEYPSKKVVSQHKLVGLTSAHLTPLGDRLVLVYSNGLIRSLVADLKDYTLNDSFQVQASQDDIIMRPGILRSTTVHLSDLSQHLIAVAVNQEVQVYDIYQVKLVCKFKCKGKIQCLKILNPEKMIFATENEVYLLKIGFTSTAVLVLQESVDQICSNNDQVLLLLDGKVNIYTLYQNTISLQKTVPGSYHIIDLNSNLIMLRQDQVICESLN